MKRLLGFSLILFFIMFIHAEKSVKSGFLYPVADIDVIEDSHTLKLMPDGRVEETVYIKNKILTYDGMDTAGDPKVSFNKNLQELHIEKCVTHMPDGKIVEAKNNSFNEMTPFELEKAPEYTINRQMVITHVGLDINSISELKFIISDKKPFRDNLSGYEVLGGADPISLKRVTIVIPHGKKLNWSVMGISTEPEIITAQDEDTYIFTFKNLPAYNLEKTDSAERGFIPALIFSTAASWEDAVFPKVKTFRESISEISEGLKIKTKSIISESKNQEDTIRRCNDYVGEYINTVNWQLSAFDYKPRKASGIYTSGYGNSLDKAVLLCAMLKECGIDAIPVLISKRFDIADTPSIEQFDSTWVETVINKEKRFLDPSKKMPESEEYYLVGHYALPLKDGALPYRIEKNPSIESKSLITISAEMKEDLTINGKAEFLLTGYYSQFEAVRVDSGTMKDTIKSVLSGIVSDVNIQDVNVGSLSQRECSFSANFTAKIKKPFDGAVKSIQFGIPGNSLLKKITGLYRTERSLPLHIPYIGEESLKIDLTLPASVKVLSIPKNSSISDNNCSYSQSCINREGHIKIDEMMQIKANIIDTASYPSFRKIYGMILSNTSSLIIFE